MVRTKVPSGKGTNRTTLQTNMSDRRQLLSYVTQTVNHIIYSNHIFNLGMQYNLHWKFFS